MKQCAFRSLGSAPAGRAGGIMVIVVVAVMTVAGAAASMLYFQSLAVRRQASALEEKHAFYLAEAGLAEAYSGLLVGKTGNVGSAEQPAAFGDGLLWVTATELDADRVELECNAMVGRGRAVLAMVAERGEQSVGALGVFGEATLALVPGVFIDAYDSSLGAYGGAAEEGAEPAASVAAKVGSNGPIQAKGTTDAPVLVLGDLTPGPSQAVQLMGQAFVSGSTAPAPDALELPPVAVPDVELGPGVSHTGLVPLYLSDGTALQSLTVGRGAKVVVQGPGAIVLGRLTVQPGGELVLDAEDGPLSVIVEDALDIQSNAHVSFPNADPAAVALQVAGTGPVQLGTLDPFHGAIYAPSASVAVGAGFELFGSIAGEQLVFGGPARLHFDTRLAAAAEAAALPRFLSWKIIEVASESTSGVSDPFTLLGLDRAALPLPADAHADQQLEVEYVDQDGFAQSYAGLESGFDWELVSAVLSVSRDGTALSPDGPGDAVQVGAGKPPPAAEAAPTSPLLDLVGDLALASSELKSALLAASPLPDDVLLAALERVPPLDPSDLKAVLLANPPLDQSVLDAVLDAATLGVSELRDVLRSTPSLADPILLKALPVLDSSSLKDVLIDNSPLSPAVLLAVTSRIPPLNLGDLTQVLLAQ